MNSVSSVSHSPLTQTDIARMPNNAVNQPANHQVATDTYNGKKSSGLKKTIFSLVVIAAALVALKHWGKESFMKIADSNNMKWYDHIKSVANTAANWIEKPFVAGYKAIAGLFGKKAA